MSTGSGPLGRSSVPFAETMRRYHGEIERLVYAAETCCYNNGGACFQCPFEFTLRIPGKGTVLGVSCMLKQMRLHIGDHAVQHDVMPGVPPCQCGGDCGKCKEAGE